MAGETANAWMIRSRGGFVQNNAAQIAIMQPNPGDMENNEDIELTFDFSTKKMIVVANDVTGLSCVCNIDTNNPIYFVWAAHGAQSTTVTLLE